MPRPSKNRNPKLTEWVNHGLRPGAWAAGRSVQIGVLVGIALAVAALYLLQSSEIVTATRRLQALRNELTAQQLENAGLAAAISREGAIEQLRQRAAKLGFQPAGEVVYLPVDHLPLDDVPTMRLLYLR
jgi:hypothetical protein